MTKRSTFIFLLIFSILPLLDLLHPGLPVTHDGQDHVARIANFYQSLAEGNMVPRWAGNLNWGFGHPILMFLYPLPSYVASFFHFIGFSFVDSTKLVFAVSYIASIFAMFFWTEAQWGSVAGLIAGLLYGFAPYRFVDLYVRGALGEHVAFVFPPLILYGLWRLTKEKKIHWSGIAVTLGTAGLVLSHNAVSLMFLPVIFLYIVYLFFFESKMERIFLIRSFLYIFLGFMMSAFFWMPAFFEGKYTLRDIVTKGDFRDRFVPFSWFLYSPWNYGGGGQFSKSLGLFQWVGVIGSLIAFWKIKQRNTRWIIGIHVFIILISLFFMTSWSFLLWEKISLLQKFQFPWRLLTLAVFSAAVLGSVVIVMLKKRISSFVVYVISFSILATTASMWHSKAYSAKSQDFYTGIYKGTTDTGESSPIWSTRFMETKPVGPMISISGPAMIASLSRISTRHEYNVSIPARTRFVENTLYFPGWNVSVDGKPVSIEFQDPLYRGLITFWVDSGQHRVNITFRDTKLRSIANVTSILGIIVLGFLVIVSKRVYSI